MKYSLVLMALLLSQLAMASSIREKRIKLEMLDRVGQLILKVESAREDLKKDDVISACRSIHEMFELYPEHLKDIAGHLDPYSRRSTKATNRALNELALSHKKSILCKQGKNAEHVDAKELNKELKKVERSLKKQRRIIKNSDTDFDNSFYYKYEF